MWGVVLRGFIRFAGGRTGLRDDLIAETLETVDPFAPEFHPAMA